jgi:hypothetical protein
MARSTAKDKLRVALELTRRPAVAAAFAAGELSYSKVRAITRVIEADDATDAALLEVARTGTAADLERLARHWELLADQERPLDDAARFERRGVRRLHRYDGMAALEVVLASEDEARVLAVIDAYIGAVEGGVERSPVDKASAASTGGDVLSRPSWAQRRADAVVDLLEAGLAHLEAGGEVDPEVAVVEVVVDYDVLCERVPGTAVVAGVPLAGEAARRLACDAGVARIVMRGKSEVLNVGRKTRQWNRAQRRAIRFRHDGACAFPGCGRRITQIHHCTPWTAEGRTDLDAGVPVCWGHHRLVHEGGWTVAYEASTGTTVFVAPDGRQVRTPARLTLAA